MLNARANTKGEMGQAYFSDTQKNRHFNPLMWGINHEERIPIERIGVKDLLCEVNEYTGHNKNVFRDLWCDLMEDLSGVY